MSLWDVVERYAEARSAAGHDRALWGALTDARRESIDNAEREAKARIEHMERTHAQMFEAHKAMCEALRMRDYADGQGWHYAWPGELREAVERLRREHSAAMALLGRVAKYATEDRAKTPRTTRLARAVAEARAMLEGK